ncbi:MAG: DegT/DnrJ/EryC1/StrS aminotransferase family protein [Coriobacteriia bacterium]|nr:DegT/DnrJ/EryC1/StrS aminotransferase family protein [Coriobacteriia bacterium]
MPPWPSPGREEIAAAEAVLRSGRLSYWTGEEVRSFEREYAEALGRGYAIAVANGTVALELALRAFGIGAGDEVVVPARTFIATASAVVAAGAKPVVADVDRESGNLAADAVRGALTERTRALLPVHVGGWPADMGPLKALAEERGLVVIEDCAQSHGASYRGRPVGAVGDAAAFSFCQDKILPTGEGGMLLLDDEAAHERAWAYKDHGKSLRKVSEPAYERGGVSFRWLVDTFGTNWRLGELEGALGRVGLRKLHDWSALRRRNALRLAEGISGLPALRVPLPARDVRHAFYRLYAYVVPDELAAGWDRDRVAAAVAAEGVPCQYGTCAEIYREAAFAAAGLGPRERLPVAAELHDTQLAFLVHPTIEPEDVDDVIAAVARVMGEASA